jgi:hypothetical protein
LGESTADKNRTRCPFAHISSPLAARLPGTLWVSLANPLDRQPVQSCMVARGFASHARIRAHSALSNSGINLYDKFSASQVFGDPAEPIIIRFTLRRFRATSSRGPDGSLAVTILSPCQKQLAPSYPWQQPASQSWEGPSDMRDAALIDARNFVETTTGLHAKTPRGQNRRPRSTTFCSQ